MDLLAYMNTCAGVADCPGQIEPACSPIAPISSAPQKAKCYYYSCSEEEVTAHDAVPSLSTMTEDERCRGVMQGPGSRSGGVKGGWHRVVHSVMKTDHNSHASLPPYIHAGYARHEHWV